MEERDINRFIIAQNSSIDSYQEALMQIRRGLKTSHWIWYIFPQLKCLGHGPYAKFYGISDRLEAIEYLNNPVLGYRIREISKALLEHSKSAVDILGFIDALKVKSSMTMFDCICPNDIFSEVLDKFYNGERCETTKQMLNQ